VISDNRTLSWAFAEQQGINHISGDLNNWTSNGTNSNVQPFTVMFNRTGDFDLIFQAFDLDTGKAISLPLKVGEFKVPVAGSLAFQMVGGGSYVTTPNGTYFEALLNVTNNWNIRYSVMASNLYISNGVRTVSANLSAMSFTSQSLTFGQSTQFMAYFSITGDVSHLKLEYRDTASGQVIPVPLS
jgi:hypothetical protein